MKNKFLPILHFVCLIVFVLLSINVISIDANITINAPSFKETQNGYLQITINSNETFNGTIYLAYQNVTGTSPIIISEGDFISGTANYNITLSAASQRAYQINANLSSSDGSFSRLIQATNIVTDGVAPIISSAGPSGNLTTNSITLTAQTNEISSCRYSTEDKAYSLMENNMSGTTIHTAALTLSDSTYRYYVRCADSSGNEMMSSFQIYFSVATETYADISMNKQSPLTAGIVEVTLMSSKNMADISLNYYYSDTPATTYSIPLSGNNNLWKGFMIVPETTTTRIGTFSITGTDIYGKPLSRINTGKLFIIDTTKPHSITDVSATGELEQIRLRWFYEGDIKKFNIYRSEKDDVSYVDLYKDTNESFYVDKNVNTDKIYYYRIAAVTDSGNVGSLTDFVSAKALESPRETPISTKSTIQNSTQINQKSASETVPQKAEETKENSISTQRKLDAKINEISNLILDIERSESDFNKNEDAIEKSAIANLEIKDIISASKDNMNIIKKELQNLKESYIEENEADKIIEAYSIKLKQAKMSVPKKIQVVDKSTILQETGPEDVLLALNSVFNETEAKDNLDLNKNINEKVDVEINYKVVELTYLDDSKEKKTIIEKLISYKDPVPVKKVSIVETIPKTLAAYADDVSFKTKYIKIVKNDPVVSLDLDELNYDAVRLVYVLKDKKDIDEVKKSKTIAVTKNTINQKLTGFSVFKISTGTTTFDIAITVSVIFLIVLTGYYFMFVKEEPREKKSKEIHGMIPNELQSSQMQSSTQQNNIGQQMNRMNQNAVIQNTAIQNNPKSMNLQDLQSLADLKKMQSENNLANQQNLTNQNYLGKIDSNYANLNYANSQYANKQAANNPQISNSQISKTINEGHYHIDNVNYELASQAYTKALGMYNSANPSLTIYDKNMIESSLTMLYDKLLLINKLGEAYFQISRRNMHEARLAIEECTIIFERANLARSSSYLCEYASSWTDYMKKQITQKY